MRQVHQAPLLPREHRNPVPCSWGAGRILSFGTVPFCVPAKTTPSFQGNPENLDLWFLPPASKGTAWVVSLAWHLWPTRQPVSYIQDTWLHLLWVAWRVGSLLVLKKYSFTDLKKKKKTTHKEHWARVAQLPWLPGYRYDLS